MATRAKGLNRTARGVCAIVAVLVAACTATNGPASVDATASGNAQRVVSLVPALTEILFAVGAGDQVVGVSSFDTFPPEARTRPRVGALLDPDVEKILSLRPDLVLVYGSQSDLEDRFSRVGIRVYPYRHGGLANVLKTIQELGTLTGHAAEGGQLADRLEDSLDTTRRRIAGRVRPRTMLVMGRDPLTLRGVYVSGGVGFLHELLDIAGGEDVFGDIAREGVQPSNETMIARAPDVIVEVHGGDPPSEDVLRREREVWSLLTSVPAVKNNRVYLLYGEHLVSPGPRLAQAADDLARVLHPDAYD